MVLPAIVLYTLYAIGIRNAGVPVAIALYRRPALANTGSGIEFGMRCNHHSFKLCVKFAVKGYCIPTFNFQPVTFLFKHCFKTN